MGDEQLGLHLLHGRQQVFHGEGNHEEVVGARRELVALVNKLEASETTLQRGVVGAPAPSSKTRGRSQWYLTVCSFTRARLSASVQQSAINKLDGDKALSVFLLLQA